MGRIILAVIVAMIAALSVLTIVEMLKTLTTGQTVDVVRLVGYFLAALAGGFIVRNMSRRESPGMAMPILIGSILTVGAIVNFTVLLPGQPVWFVILGLIIFIPVSLLGAKLAGR
ncbi:MAG: hypothetical protein ABL959_15795 [Pyrinomonadaceae bacterium]